MDLKNYIEEDVCMHLREIDDDHEYKRLLLDIKMCIPNIDEHKQLIS
jgi:hypothetical protein